MKNLFEMMHYKLANMSQDLWWHIKEPNFGSKQSCGLKQHDVCGGVGGEWGL